MRGIDSRHVACGIAMWMVAGAAAAGAAPAQSTSSFTCLQGFVWRAITKFDRVCVTPAVKQQTDQDTAAAPQRLRGDGTDNCADGFVWREAVPNDRVCVTPTAKQQVIADNRAALSRKNLVLLNVKIAYEPVEDQCDDSGTCTRVEDDGSSYYVVARQINMGKARLNLRRANGRLLATWRVDSVRHPEGRPGGYVEFDTRRPPCRGTKNAYFQIVDPVSGRTSIKRWVRVGCARL